MLYNYSRVHGVFPPLPLLKIESLERELEEVGHSAAQYEEDMTEESQSQDLQLVDSQVCVGVLVWVGGRSVWVCWCGWEEEVCGVPVWVAGNGVVYW